MTKEFTVSTTCPQCGLESTETYDEQTMRERFGNDSTVTVLCAGCQADFEQPLACAFELCRIIRDKGNVPVIMVTA